MELFSVAGVRNLTQIEAAERARLLDVTSYDITIDLTDGTGGPGERTFRSTTVITFSCTEPGASTFIEAAMDRIRSATLNGSAIDVAGWSAEKGLTLTDLAAQNTLVIDADALYSTTGQGLHRSVDPVDKEVYLYSQFETADAQRVFASFDQPDLKSVYTWHVTVPAHWSVISNSPVERTEPGEYTTSKTLHFAPSARMSTYITAICAGPYHEVRKQHDGIDLGIFCRPVDEALPRRRTTCSWSPSRGSTSSTSSSASAIRCRSTTRCSCPSSTPARWRTSAASCTASSTTSSGRRSPTTSTRTAPTRSCTRWRTCGSATS